MLDVSDYKSSIKRSIDDIQKLRQSVRDESVLHDLDIKEKQLGKMLMSGMENFQPNLNMFGSNVFSSIQTDLMNMKQSYDQVTIIDQQNMKTIENASSNKPNGDLDDILTAQKSKNLNPFTMGGPLNESLHNSSENLTINITRQDAEPQQNMTKLAPGNRSRQKLDKLKNDYNQAMLDDMFPSKN